MHRRSFLKAGGALSVAAGLGAKPLLAHISRHNFYKYAFGSGPAGSDRLYQGAFSADGLSHVECRNGAYAFARVVPNCGMGFITYLCDEAGPGDETGA